MSIKTNICITTLCILIAAIFIRPPEVLKGLDSNKEYSSIEVQAIVSAFCLSPIVGQLLDRKKESFETVGGEFEFSDDGDIENEDYAQSSIYAILYAMYKNTGKVKSNLGVEYQFTFNTWGIAPSPYPVEEPQRHGMAAYAGLATQPPAKEYGEKMDGKLKIVEIGCGTGAGANLITREVWPDSEYLALDMQAAAVNTCKEIHATPDNPGLTCRLVPNGVGNEGNNVPDTPDESVDFVIISETHIADIEIGELEKSIFAEIRRILKPGGLFLWGNALPTRVWEEATRYLSSDAAGFELVNEYNHTKGAVVARDEDYDRVEAYIDSIINQYPVMKVPYFGPRCAKVTDRLIANFYRHPGTALYLKMVSGYDSYLHQAWRKK